MLVNISGAKFAHLTPMNVYAEIEVRMKTKPFQHLEPTTQRGITSQKSASVMVSHLSVDLPLRVLLENLLAGVTIPRLRQLPCFPAPKYSKCIARCKTLASSAQNWADCTVMFDASDVS